ncbi:MAG: PASTA domain-containing protein [Gaiellaceae bacterium]
MRKNLRVWLVAAATALMVAPAAISSPGPLTHTLTVSKSGSGSGTVESSPAGIDCGTTCSRAYAGATIVTLTATPAAGSTFTGWSGECTGTGSCTVTIDSDKTVTASFGLAPKMCVVPKVKGKTLKRAKRVIKGHACKVGTIKRTTSRTVEKGHVISQKPKPGRTLKHGARVNLVVSKGRG